MKFDANKVWPGIYVGSAPPELAIFEGFSLVALCAAEYQPNLPNFFGKVVRPAFKDSHDPIPGEDVIKIFQAADAVAKDVAAGGRCLVTCIAGLNRSALVAALAILQSTNLSSDEIIAIIRSKRKPFPPAEALYNKRFIELLKLAESTRTAD